MSVCRRQKGRGYLTYWYVSFAILLLISGCMHTAVLLDANILTADKIHNVEAAKQKFNTLRFEPAGGRGDNFIGYVLFRDGVEVRASGYVRDQGKMTLSEVLAEYERYLRVETVSVFQSRATVNEILREGNVIGYTLICDWMTADLWEDTSQKDPSRIVLMLAT